MNLSKDLMAASSTPLVLGIIAEGETYGYEIVKRVEELSGGVLSWTDGMMYPLLHRLEKQGYLQANWHIAETGRKRKYYAITPSGRQFLTVQQQQWQVINQTLNRVWDEMKDFNQWSNNDGFQPA
ncbi:PadR family transcriptional regulator [Neptunicella sp. SCSIO 80796]|uniref:PadR family transcriptional regulator n=1 Tax=Neptunicella plasticusilytica TaxID=3117012 RepID=UPI003A4DC2F9